MTEPRPSRKSQTSVMNAIEPAPAPAKKLSFYGVELGSRLLLGTSRYPSPQSMQQSVRASGAEIVTVSLRREQARGRTGERFMDIVKELGVHVLPNTAGCRTPKEAITTAQMARELFGTKWIKLEVIGNDDTPSHAAQAMEMGYDVVLLNTAVATAADPVRMAVAFAGALVAGRSAYEAGLMEMRDMAVPSTPLAGTPFFDLSK